MKWLKRKENEEIGKMEDNLKRSGDWKGGMKNLKKKRIVMRFKYIWIDNFKKKR